MTEKKLTAAERFQKMIDASKANGSYYIDGAKVELSEQIYIAMEDSGVTEAELARRIGSSRAYINKVLQGATNFTIESLVKIGLALGREFRFEFVPLETEKAAVKRTAAATPSEIKRKLPTNGTKPAAPRRARSSR